MLIIKYGLINAYKAKIPLYKYKIYLVDVYKR